MKNKSILTSVHESATDLHESGLITAQTMREFDSMCLAPVQDMSPSEIKSLRQREKVSQPVMAKYLNTSPSTVKKWEAGEKHPRGTSLKLLNLILRKGLVAIA